MAPAIQKFLLEGSSLVSYAGRDIDSLVQYLDKNMLLLKDKLNEANFEKVLSIIWESSAKSLSDTIHLSIEVYYILITCTFFLSNKVLLKLSLSDVAPKVTGLLQNTARHPERADQLFLR
jgi:hypothetical protein